MIDSKKGKVYKDIDVEDLREAPYNVPGRTSDEDIQWLVESIKQKGLLHNLVVVERGDEEKYEIVCGNRRAKAAKEAGIRTVRCEVISKDTTQDERELMNLTENVHRKDLSYSEQFSYVAKILKSFDHDTNLVAIKLGWPQTRITDLLKFGKLSDRQRKRVRSPDAFKVAVATVGLPEEKGDKLIEIARELLLSPRTVANITERLKESPELEVEEAFGKIKKKSAKVCIVFDGEWNEFLTNAADAIDTSKMAYVEEATKRRLRADGFSPQVDAMVNEAAIEKLRES